jgi:S-DNA-T family DNA segregation ATPase FtsK/SpoIIIE
VAPAASAIANQIRGSSRSPGSSAVQVIDIAHSNDSSDVVAVTTAARGAVQIVLGDPAAWQARWSLLAAVRGSIPVVFAGCSVAEFRALTGIRRLPPPIGSAPGGAWHLAGDGAVGRVQLPEWLLVGPAAG